MAVFADLKIAVDGNNYGEKQKISKLVKDHGAFVPLVVNNETSLMVSTDKTSTYKTKHAIKCGKVEPFDEYVIDFGDEEPDKPVIKFDINNFQTDMISKYDLRDKNSRLPYFPPEYEILKTNLLQKDKLFCKLELHVGGSGVNEVAAQGKKSGYERSYFRVFIHHGKFSEISLSSLECVPAESLTTAEETYGKIYKEYKHKRYYNSRLSVKSQLGSERSREIECLSLEGTLPEKVKELVMTLYNEAIVHLCDVLSCHDGLSVDPQGKFTAPFGKLALAHIEHGESILLQIDNLLQASNSTKEIESLVKEFYNVIPICKTKLPITANLQQTVLQDLSDIQCLKDFLFIVESLGSQQQSLENISSVENKYLAIGCEIKHVAEKSPEYNTVVSAIDKSVLGEGKIKVENLYSINRREERDAFDTFFTNQKMLFHGCNANSVAGILARGVLPQIKGNLGSGKYFASDAAEIVKVSQGGGKSGKRYFLISQVGLGTIRKYTSQQINLTSCPEGFDSVQGVKTGARPTDFLYDTFVVYNQNQSYLTYLVEFTSEIGQEEICEDCNSAKITDLKVMHVFANEIDTENVPHLQPPLPSPPVLTKAGLMLTSKQQNHYSPVSLKSTHVSVKIVDLVSEVTMIQHFVNVAVSEAAIYILPLNEKTSISGFECFVNGIEMVYQVVENKNNKPSPHAESHVEEIGSVFIVNVGLIPPDAHVIIKIKYIADLVAEDDNISCFPTKFIIFTILTIFYVTFVFPAYLSPTKEEVEKNPTDPLLGFSLQASIDMPHDISGLVSLYTIHTKRVHTQATVAIAEDNIVNLSSDFILYIGLEEAHESRMWLEVDENGHYASMLSIYPRFDMEFYREVEFIFLIDSSCSMQESMPALQQILRSLLSQLQKMTNNIKFNIISAAGTYTQLFVSNKRVTKTTLQKAWTYVNDMKVHYGKTNIYDSLYSIYLRAYLKQIPTSVFLFTDGKTNQGDKLLNLIRQNSSIVKLFPYGIGANASSHFVKLMAEAGSSVAEFVHNKTIPNPDKIKLQLNRAAQPAYSISVVFDSTDNTTLQAPLFVPPIFPGDSRTVYAFAGNCSHAKVIATAPGGRIFESSVHVRQTSYIKGSTIHGSFVKSLIQDYIHGKFSNILFLDDSLRRQVLNNIILLSAKYSIESKFAKYILINQRELTHLPNINDMISREKIDHLSNLIWKEVEEERFLREAELEAESYRSHILSSAMNSRKRKNYRDFADSMYKYAGMKTKCTLKELRILGIATKSIVKPCLEELKEEGKKLAAKGKTSESLRFKRAQGAVESEVLKLMEVLEKEVEPLLTEDNERAYVEILKNRCSKILSVANMSITEVNDIASKKRKNADNARKKKSKLLSLITDEVSELAVEFNESQTLEVGLAEYDENYSSEDEDEEEYYLTEEKSDDEKVAKLPQLVYEEIKLQEQENHSIFTVNNNPTNSTFHHPVKKCTHSKKVEEPVVAKPAIRIRRQVVARPEKQPEIYNAFIGFDAPTEEPEEIYEEIIEEEEVVPEVEAPVEGTTVEQSAAGQAVSNAAEHENPTVTAEEVIALMKEPSNKKKKGKSTDTKKKLRQLISDNLLLRKLKPHQVDQLVAAMSKKPFRAGKYVCVENEKGDYFYLVEEGALEVYSKGNSMLESKKGILQDGSAFGEAALWKNSLRMASVKTKTECILWWVGRDTFIKATEQLKSQFNSNEQHFQNIEIFSKLSEYEKCMLRVMGQVKKYDDTYLFKEGETLTHFFVLISGTWDGMKGAKKATNFGEYFYHGYKSLTTNTPTKFSVKAMGYALVMTIDKRDFLEFIAPAVHRNFSFECPT